MTQANVRTSRVRVPRSRGAVGGILLVLGGLWAGLVPFVGPYGNLAFTPDPNATWKWTAARGWLEVLPGGVAVVGGLLLVTSTNRLLASLGGWLGVAAGAWLVIAPTMAEPLELSLGTPDPNQTTAIRVAEELSFFFGIGAAIVLVAGLALGRLSVLSVRDVQAAERRAAIEAEQDAEEARFAEEQRLLHQHRTDREQAGVDGAATGGYAAAEAPAEAPAERTAEFRRPGDRPEDGYARPTDADRPTGNEPERISDPDRASDIPVDHSSDVHMDRPADRSDEADHADHADMDDPGGAHRTERLRQADERFAAERARIAAEHRHDADGDPPAAPDDSVATLDTPVAGNDATASGEQEPAHAVTPESPQRSYPPFYGNSQP